MTRPTAPKSLQHSSSERLKAGRDISKGRAGHGGREANKVLPAGQQKLTSLFARPGKCVNSGVEKDGIGGSTNSHEKTASYSQSSVLYRPDSAGQQREDETSIAASYWDDKLVAEREEHLLALDDSRKVPACELDEHGAYREMEKVLQHNGSQRNTAASSIAWTETGCSSGGGGWKLGHNVGYKTSSLCFGVEEISQVRSPTPVECATWPRASAYQVEDEYSSFSALGLGEHRLEIEGKEEVGLAVGSVDREEELRDEGARGLHLSLQRENTQAASLVLHGNESNLFDVEGDVEVVDERVAEANHSQSSTSGREAGLSSKPGRNLVQASLASFFAAKPRASEKGQQLQQMTIARYLVGAELSSPQSPHGAAAAGFPAPARSHLFAVAGERAAASRSGISSRDNNASRGRSGSGSWGSRGGRGPSRNGGWSQRSGGVPGPDAANGLSGPGEEESTAVRECPFYKRIPGTSFTVDAFRYGAVKGVTAYFLSHFHYDHYGGLTKGWSHGLIYCTPITARLISLCIGVDQKWIRPLEINVPCMIAGVEVTFLEANHCPGAALILFRLYNGHVALHTGDFRASMEMRKCPELVHTRIDSLYLDTTYCNPKYSFPPQETVLRFAVRVAQETMRANPRTLVAVGAYSIGKERVFMAVAQALGARVFADSHRARVLRALEWPDLTERLTADKFAAGVHVLPLSAITPKKLEDHLQGLRPRFSSVLAFRPTGWTYSEKKGLEDMQPQRSACTTVYGVPYSEHSSFTELRDFVQFLRPSKIIPTVNVGSPSERARMMALFQEWLSSGAMLYMQ